MLHFSDVVFQKWTLCQLTPAYPTEQINLPHIYFRDWTCFVCTSTYAAEMQQGQSTFRTVIQIHFIKRLFWAVSVEKQKSRSLDMLSCYVILMIISRLLTNKYWICVTLTLSSWTVFILAFQALIRIYWNHLYTNNSTPRRSQTKLTVWNSPESVLEVCKLLLFNSQVLLQSLDYNSVWLTHLLLPLIYSK